MGGVMRHPLAFIGALVIASGVAVPPSAITQQRPNFAGSWTLQHVAADPRMRTFGGPDFFAGSRMVVEQNGETLVVTQSAPYAHPRISFALDGSASPNTLPQPHGGSPWHFVTRATWDRDTLVLDTKEPWEMMSRWSLTPDGQLSIQVIAPNIEVRVSTTHVLYSRK
jgi:hypothetical protein